MFFSQGRRRWLVRGVVRADRDRCLGGNPVSIGKISFNSRISFQHLRDFFEFT